MKNLTEISIKRPVTSLMIFISFLVIGSIASKLLPLEFFPDISYPGVYVELPYPASTPEEVEQQITRPVEEVLSTIPDVEFMRSSSSENQAGIFVRFAMGVNTDLKTVQVKEKIEGIRHLLPDDFRRYRINRFSAQDSPVLQVRISSKRDLKNAYDLLERNIKQRLERIDGVSQVTLYGVEKREVQIELIPERIAQYGIDIQSLVAQLQNSNFSISAGKVTQQGKRYMVRPVGQLQNAEEIGNIILNKSNVRLKHIADISYKQPKVQYGRHLDQTYAVGLDIFKESGANTVQVVEDAMAEIDRIKSKSEMRGINLYVMSNLADGIISSLSELLNSGLLGAIFSVIVLYMFLRQFSTTIMVTLAVPFSLIVTLACLYFLDMSLNILSMTGLMLAVGMLVDNAVVVTENIHRHRLTGKNPVQSAIDAVKEVGMAVTAGTLTSIIVFLPNIVTKTDMLAVQLKHVAVSICISLAASLLISITIIPLISTKLKFGEKEKKEAKWIIWLSEKYGKTLGYLARRKWVATGLILFIVGTAVIPFQFTKVDMFDRAESREVRLIFRMNGTYVLDKVEKEISRVEEALYAHQDELEIESVYTYYTPGQAQSTIKLIEGDEVDKSVDEIKERIKEILPKIAIAEIVFDWNDMGGQEATQIHLIGESTRELTVLAEEAVRRLSQIDGLGEVRSEASAGNEEVRLVIDRERSRAYGISSQQVAQTVSSVMRGQQMRSLRTDNGEIDVRLSFREEDRTDINDLKKIMLRAPGQDQPVQLASIARFEVGPGPREIVREDRSTSLSVTAEMKDLDMNEAKKQIKTVMDQINYPAGYGWSYGRSFRESEQVMNSMLRNMLLGLALIYLIMSALFESTLYPASIITSILFAVIGVFWFFFFTGTTFSLMAMIGILVLMGIVVNNGIVLIDHVNNLRADGWDRTKAIVQAGQDRMRPILMTAGTTVLGLVPLCLGNTQIGGDGPPYFPMARAIVGGLIFSTVVTLIVLPTIYVFLDDLKNWSRMVWKRSALK